MVDVFTEAGWDVSRWTKDNQPTNLLDVQYIVHCGENIPAKNGDGDPKYAGNIGAMQRILLFAEKSNITRICNLSSMDAFGAITAPVVDHETPSESPNNYGSAKLINESMLEKWTQAGRSAVSIRLPGVIGKGAHHNFLSKAMASILNEQTIHAHSPDALFNNVIHVRDLARFVVHLHHAIPMGHQVVTVGCSGPVKMCDVVERLISVSGKKSARVSWMPGTSGFLIGYGMAESLGYKPQSTYSTVGRILE